MPLMYKAITAALALSGCLSLVTTGELNPVFLAPGAGMLPGYYRHLKGLPMAPRWAIGGLSLAAIAVLLFEVFVIRGDYFVALAHMTIAFQAIKSFDLKEPWDPLQVYFMALLQLIIASELGLSIVFGVVFVVFLVIFIAAIVFSHFIKEGTIRKVRLARPLAVVTLSVFVSTLFLFVAVPRVKGGYLVRKHGNSIRTVGFSESVDFGSFGPVLGDSTIVMRAEVTGPRLPLYWRGTSLDQFDGVSWSNSLRPEGRAFKSGGKFQLRPGRRGEYTVQKIVAEPLDTNVLFGLGDIVLIESPGYMVEFDREGALYQPMKGSARFPYTVYSLPESGGRVKERGLYLQVPEGMERTRALARGLLTPDMDDLAKARRAEAYLRNNFTYSLETAPPPPGMTPVEDFLFNSKRGFCEHYATAMVLLLRASGVPARLVTGFYGGEENAYGDYIIVRQSNAHSWVEAGVEGRWMRFDPTPLVFPARRDALTLFADSLRMRWYRYVIGFSSSDQLDLLRHFTAPSISFPRLPFGGVSLRPLYLAAAIVILIFLFLKLPARLAFRLRQLPPETVLYLKFRAFVKKRGGRVGSHSTSSEVRGVALALSLPAVKVMEFMRLYEDARFGGGSFHHRMREIYKELKGRKG